MKHAASSVCLAAALLAGCAATGADRAADPAPACVHNDDTGHSNETLHLDGSLDAYDPWNRFNRAVYRFNARFDDAIHFPVANTYRRWMPRAMRTGVGNFFTNLGEIRNTANHLLQGRVRHSLRSAARFAVNSTFGIAGLFDVAGPAMELEHAPTGFGDTLGRWGVGAGPYLILPILGPSTLRDGLGQGADLVLNRTLDPIGIYRGDTAIPVGTLYAIDTRSRLSFRYYQTGSPFEYELVRFLYTRKRAIEIHGARTRAAYQEAEDAEDSGDSCGERAD